MDLPSHDQHVWSEEISLKSSNLLKLSVKLKCKNQCISSILNKERTQSCLPVKTLFAVKFTFFLFPDSQQETTNKRKCFSQHSLSLRGKQGCRRMKWLVTLCPHPESRERADAGTLLAFPYFILCRNLGCGILSPIFRVGLPLQLNSSRNILTDTPRGFKPSQVNNED